MSLNVARLGTYDKQSESDTINIGRMRSFGPVLQASTGFWAIGVGWWGGRDGGSTPDVTAAAYAWGSGSSPYSRLGVTTAVSNGTSMSDSSGGTRYERTLTTIDVAGSYPRSGTKLPVFAGSYYMLALLAETAILRYSATITGVSGVNPGSTQERGSLTDPPTSYSPTTSVTPPDQRPTVYLYGYENVAPEAPGIVSPSGTVQSLTPQFTAAFNDLNGAYGTSSGNGVDTGDALTAYDIEVRETSTTGTVMWNTTITATNAEALADLMDRTYAGSALTRGNTYYWRCRHKDIIGSYGPWSSWTSFTVASRGFVTLDGAPNGKQSVNTGITFNGKWTSVQSQSTDRVQIRLLASDQTTVLQTSAEITKTVAHAAPPGTAFTITWADSGFTTLNWGTTYYYQIRGRDTSSQWSNWSAARSFFTNAAPLVPTGLSPANNQVWTTYPKLSATISDNDDTNGTGLTGVFRITRPDTSTVDCTPTWNGSTSKYEFQTTATELSAFGTYSWRATGYDTVLYTGEASALGSAIFSNPATFQYLSGPAVTITAPTDGATVATSSLTVTWTVTGQVSRQVRLYDLDTGALVYDSGDTVTGTLSFTIPAGSYRNNTSYTLAVSVTNSTPLTGTSSVTIHVAYTAPSAPDNIQVSTERYGIDPVDNGVRVTWDQTTYPLSGDPRFYGISVYRTVVGGPEDGRVRLLFTENPAVTIFTDPHPISGYDVTYEVVQSVVTGVDIVDSDPSGGTVQIELGRFHVLSLVENPTVYRAVLTNVAAKPVGDVTDQAVYPSLAGGAPVTIYGGTYYQTRSLNANVIAYGSFTAEQIIDGYQAMREQLGTICYRDGAGNKAFYAIESSTITPQMGDTSGRYFVLDLTLREENLTEGELAG